MRLLERLHQAGLSPSLPDSVSQRPGLALALGGLGMTLEQVVTLYRGLAAGGSCQPLSYITGITEEKQILAPGPAWQVNEILRHSPLAPVCEESGDGY